ncbi:DoxX family protein [soil metagenome]
MDSLNVALLVLRLAFGLGLAAHGVNKVVGGQGLAGTTGWFRSIGMKWPAQQARLAAGTEIGAGSLLAVGLLTPLAAAGMIGVMVVAAWVGHRQNGFFSMNNGWELNAYIAVAAWAVGAIGPARFSLDRALGIGWSGWWGAVVALVLGIGAGVAQLAVSYRPPVKP